MLASTLPLSSHFYLSWFVLQWFTYTLILLRYMQLFKYSGLVAGMTLISNDDYKRRKAKFLAEPENPDCYGIGARSAETVLLLAVALVYCSLIPIICLFGFITFAITRIIYGYLI